MMTDTTIFTRPRGTHNVAQALFFMAIAAASFYLLMLLTGLGQFAPEFQLIAKGMPVLLLAIAALVWRHDLTGWLTAAALLASSLGDVLLAWPGDRFDAALRSFALAHAFYIGVFLINRAPVAEVGVIQTRLASGLWAVAVLVAFQFWPLLDMRDPSILAYGMILAVMATSALLSRFITRLVGVGALLFVASDVLIIADRMSLLPTNWPEGWVQPTIWVSYMVAQVGLLLGIMIGPSSRYPR